MSRPPKTLALIVIVMSYLPLVAVLALVGYAFGWRFPTVLLVFLGVSWYRARRSTSRPVPVGRFRTIAEVLVFSLAGSIFGGLLFGALGVFAGFMFGFAMRLAEVPITPSRRRKRRA